MLLTEVAGHLRRIELLLHVDWAHRVALRSQYLLLASGIVAHKLLIYHSRLHVEVLAVHVRRATDWLHVLWSLALGVLGRTL